MNVMAKRDAPVRPDLNNPELNNLAMSKEAQPLFDAVMKHIEENVAPISDKFFELGEGRKDNWSWAPGQLELLEGAKNKAKKSGLWNFFLPGSEMCIRDRSRAQQPRHVEGGAAPVRRGDEAHRGGRRSDLGQVLQACLLYTSDAADE